MSGIHLQLPVNHIIQTVNYNLEFQGLLVLDIHPLLQASLIIRHQEEADHRMVDLSVRVRFLLEQQMDKYQENTLHQHLASLIIPLQMVNNHLTQEFLVQEVLTHLQLLANLIIRLELEDNIPRDQMGRFLLAILLLHLVSRLDLKTVIYRLLQEMVFNPLHDILRHRQVNFIPRLAVEVMFQAEMDILEQLMATDK